MEKAKPNTTKACIHHQKNALQHKINNTSVVSFRGLLRRYINTVLLLLLKTKLKPGLVASYDIRPGNGEGLLFISVLHKFVTRLLT